MPESILCLGFVCQSAYAILRRKAGSSELTVSADIGRGVAASLTDIPVLCKHAVLKTVNIADLRGTLIFKGTLKEHKDEIAVFGDPADLHMGLVLEELHSKFDKSGSSVLQTAAVLDVVLPHIAVQLAQIPGIENLIIETQYDFLVAHLQKPPITKIDRLLYVTHSRQRKDDYRNELCTVTISQRGLSFKQDVQPDDPTVRNRFRMCIVNKSGLWYNSGNDTEERAKSEFRLADGQSSGTKRIREWGRHMLETWVGGSSLPAGIGIDLVRISALRELDQRMNGVFVSRTFSERERAEAEESADKWTYLAGRFAAKEAVFKATAHLLPEKTFDFRIVETLRAPDGCPYVVSSDPMKAILGKAGIASLLISISNEEDFAIALVQAVSG